MLTTGFVLLALSLLVGCVGGGVLVGLHRPGWWAVNTLAAVALYVASALVLTHAT